MLCPAGDIIVKLFVIQIRYPAAWLKACFSRQFFKVIVYFFKVFSGIVLVIRILTIPFALFDFYFQSGKKECCVPVGLTFFDIIFEKWLLESIAFEFFDH